MIGSVEYDVLGSALTIGHSSILSATRDKWLESNSSVVSEPQFDTLSATFSALISNEFNSPVSWLQTLVRYDDLLVAEGD